MKAHLIISVKITLITVILFGVLYPLAITGIAKIAAPNGGSGEEITVDGKLVGFELIGQKFDDDKYFNSRPSAVDYNAAATGGSNKGPTNPDYLALVQTRIDTFLVHNPSPVAAKIQIDRIAKVRHINRSKVESLVNQYIEAPTLGIGTSRVHVLKLNIALDNLK
jgi:K+-transporting ATPase ATPase C chain